MMLRWAIQRSLDGMCMEDVTVKRNSKVKTFQDILLTAIGEKKVFISPTILFSRLTVLDDFRDDVEETFRLSLTQTDILIKTRNDAKANQSKPVKPPHRT